MELHNARVIAYDRKEVSCGAAAAGQDDGKVRWYDVDTLENPEEIRELCKSFGVHPLIIEDILNTAQMAKMDNYDDCLFLVLKSLDNDREDGIRTGHIGIVLKNGCVFSFHESDRDVFARVREKISDGMDNIRRYGADYLCYELVDAVVDHYFGVIDELGDVTDRIEEELVTKPERKTLQNIYFIKRKLMFLRKSVFPLRELIGNLCSSDSGQLGGGVKIYFHDVYDHLIQIVDSIETYQDILSNMLDIYLSSVSNKTNDTMKILTIFSTIFIPLTFLAGIYGMNFKDIPELGFRYGYLAFWIVSILIAGGMIAFFHHKKWF